MHQLKANYLIDPVVQLVRMPPCHGGGRGFESRPDRKKSSRNRRLFLFILSWENTKVSAASVFSFFTITDGKVGREKVIVFLLLNLPWLAFWMFYYNRLSIRLNITTR